MNAILVLGVHPIAVGTESKWVCKTRFLLHRALLLLAQLKNVAVLDKYSLLYKIALGDTSRACRVQRFQTSSYENPFQRIDRILPLPQWRILREVVRSLQCLQVVSRLMCIV